MQDKTQTVAALVLDKLEGYLRSDAPIDPQKCKHITATLKDLQDLGLGKADTQLQIAFSDEARRAAE